jgi:RimJ/RimL family protein N-acetyltransferase
LRSITTANQEKLREWIKKHGESQIDDKTMCIGQEKDGELVGVVAFNNISDKSCQFHVASTTEYWVTRKLLFAMFDYPFNKLKVKVILAPISKDNKKSLNFGRKLGFQQVADIPYGHPNGDLIVMAMKRNQCNWLQQGD